MAISATLAHTVAIRCIACKSFSHCMQHMFHFLCFQNKLQEVEDLVLNLLSRSRDVSFVDRDQLYADVIEFMIMKAYAPLNLHRQANTLLQLYSKHILNSDRLKMIQDAVNDMADSCSQLVQTNAISSISRTINEVLIMYFCI